MRSSVTVSLRLAASFVCLFALPPHRLGGQEPWLEIKRAHYSVFYRAGFEKDAALVQTWAGHAEALMTTKYGVAPRHYRLSIYVYDAPTSNVDVNTARIHCCSPSDSGDSTGTIEMLAPSAPAFKSATATSSLLMPKNDANYHAKILTSEYIPIGHYEVQNARPTGGWKYYSAPNWFVQGLQEYDAIFHSTDTNRVITGRRLSEWAVANQAAFSCCSPDLVIKDAYNGGATFMAFLAAQFGEDVHARLLRDSSSTFAAALTSVTKPYSRPELFAKFEEWLKGGATMKP